MASHMASTATAAAQKLGQDADGDASLLAPLQLAAYRALLASVLAPVGHRPASLPLALRLFRGGLRAGPPALAAWCSQVGGALLWEAFQGGSWTACLDV